jgi:hypothetical protein
MRPSAVSSAVEVHFATDGTREQPVRFRRKIRGGVARNKRGKQKNLLADCNVRDEDRRRENTPNPSSYSHYGRFSDTSGQRHRL